MGEPFGQINSCCGPVVLVGKVVIVLVFDVEGVALVVSDDLDVTAVDFEVGIVLDVEVVTLTVCDDFDVTVVSFEVVVGKCLEREFISARSSAFSIPSVCSRSSGWGG